MLHALSTLLEAALVVASPRVPILVGRNTYRLFLALYAGCAWEVASPAPLSPSRLLLPAEAALQQEAAAAAVVGAEAAAVGAAAAVAAAPALQRQPWTPPLQSSFWAMPAVLPAVLRQELLQSATCGQ